MPNYVPVTLSPSATKKNAQVGVLLRQASLSAMLQSANGKLGLLIKTDE